MNSKILIFLTLILGTIVRALYAIKFQYFNLAPDQMASELILNELLLSGEWSYAKLIHYPQEGGSILVGLFALLLKPFFGFKSLVVVAFLLDFVSRGIQLVVVKKVFGFKPMMAYGLWTVFSIPLILPWAGLSFGLHSVASVFPFAFLYLISRPHNSAKEYFVDGLFLGLAIWFHYSNLVLLPIYILYLVFSKPPLKQIGSVALTFLGIFMIHLAVRLNVSSGFLLTDFTLGNLRGESFDLLNSKNYIRILEVYTQQLPQVAFHHDIGPIKKY